MKDNGARDIKKILIEQKTGKKFMVKDLNDSFHTSNGVISSKDLRSNENLVESSKGKKFFLIEPTFTDLWENLKRQSQIITQKDIGLILSKTGVNGKNKVVDAGGGSGSLGLSLANICKEITIYEINPEHFDVVQKNIKLFGFKNVNLKQENVYEGIKEKNVDLITLDLPEPWKVTEHTSNALKYGGHLVIYLPNINQVKMFIDSTIRTPINVIEIIEIIERKWKIENRIMRPEFEMLGHTGFLVFCRKF
jgi:tRNA (adenine57-N1/adenine58-N1)-methyltransferase catalytic subunit